MITFDKIRTRVSREYTHLKTHFKHTLGLNNPFYANARGNRILTYHGICKRDHLRFNTIFLTRAIFESHLKFYKKHCNVISLNHYYEQRFSNKQFNVCLTFDDGFANNYHYVLPLLKQYKMPATFFVTSIRDAGYDLLWNDFLTIINKHTRKNIWFQQRLYTKNKAGKYASHDDGVLLSEKLRNTGFDEKEQMMKDFYSLYPFKEKGVDTDYWQQMTPEQITSLAASPLVTIGAHGQYHNDLGRININAAADEMRCSKQYLENLTGKAVNSLAFPYGSYTGEVIKQAKQIGYNQLLALEFNNPAYHSEPTLCERFTINPFISVPNQMCATINGHYA